jgi:hypothetical protein
MKWTWPGLFGMHRVQGMIFEEFSSRPVSKARCTFVEKLHSRIQNAKGAEWLGPFDLGYFRGCGGWI